MSLGVVVLNMTASGVPKRRPVVVSRWYRASGSGALVRYAGLAVGLAACQTPPDMVRVMPALFEEHRVYVRPITDHGDTLVFYTDTGGGTNMLYAPVAASLNLPQTAAPWGADTVMTSEWPTWITDASIPATSDTTGPFGRRLMIVPFEGTAAVLQDSGDAGFLGRLWFADRVWTFDYPARQLSLRPPGNHPEHESDQRITLGFQVDSAGRRTWHFPRIRVTVLADTLDLLFDTGATMLLTDSARAEIGDDRPARRAASFISAVVFDGWRKDHPTWHVVENATSFGAAIIEVPAVDIAGHLVGPVWFERRPARTFERNMSRMMDRQIVGALGGNALGFFRVTIDYPNAVAIFQRPD